MAEAKYSVSWDDYRKSICNGLSGLQQRGEFVDMTLAADGYRVMAHKMVLSLVSPYIRELVDSTACHHPILFLNKVSHQTLQLILEYAYTGEVVVANEGIHEFLLACKDLRIKGLEGSTMNVKGAQQATCTDMEMDVQQVPSNRDNRQVNSNRDTQQVNSNRDTQQVNSYRDTQQVNSNRDTQQVNSNRDTQQVNSYRDTQQVNSKMDTQQVDSNTDMEPIVYSAESPSFDHDNDDDSASSYDEVDNESRPSVQKPVAKPTIISNTTDAGLQFTISNQGSAQIVLNRFLYNHRHTRKNGETLWRCFNYTRPNELKERCQAFVVLKDNHVLQRSCAHNHSFHDDKILRRVRVQNMFTSLTETQKMIEEKAQKKIEKKAKKNIEKKPRKNIEKKPQKNIEKNETPELKSISRPQSEMESEEIEYIEMK